MLDALFPYSRTTGDLTVRVSVNFQPETSDPSASRWFWVYHIRIENHGDADVQLINRRWEIIASGLAAGRYIIQVTGNTRPSGPSSYTGQLSFISEPGTLALLGLGLLGVGLMRRRVSA